MSPLKDALESLSSTSVSCLAYENCHASKLLEGNLECKFAVLWCSRARSLGQRGCTRAGVMMSIPDYFCICSFPWKGIPLGIASRLGPSWGKFWNVLVPARFCTYLRLPKDRYATTSCRQTGCTVRQNNCHSYMEVFQQSQLCAEYSAGIRHQKRLEIQSSNKPVQLRDSCSIKPSCSPAL